MLGTTTKGQQEGTPQGRSRGASSLLLIFMMWRLHLSSCLGRLPWQWCGASLSSPLHMGWLQEGEEKFFSMQGSKKEFFTHGFQEREVIFHGFQEIKKVFLDFKVSSPFVRARSLDHGGKVSQDHEIKKGFLDCQKERRVLLIWGFLDRFLNYSRKGSRNQEKVLLCMNLDL